MIWLVGWGLLVSWPVTVRRCPEASGLIAMLARAMNLPPPEERPEYRQVARAAVGLKSSLRKVCGFRCGFSLLASVLVAHN